MPPSHTREFSPPRRQLRSCGGDQCLIPRQAAYERFEEREGVLKRTRDHQPVVIDPTCPTDQALTWSRIDETCRGVTVDDVAVGVIVIGE